MSSDSTATSSLSTAILGSKDNQLDMADCGDADDHDLETAPQSRAIRKRRRVMDDEEDEAEEHSPRRDQVPEVTRGNEETQDEHPAAGKQRSVLLSVKVGPNSHVKFAVSQEILYEVPEYATKLDSAILKTPQGQRVRVADSKIRREESIIQAIEYLTDGILEPLDDHAMDKDQLLASLNELTSLYDFGLTMGIATLEAAIISHIGECEFDEITLVHFASECYQQTKDGRPKVSPESSLGQLIKDYLAENLQCIVSGNAYQHINTRGGPTLNKQLVEVFSENMLAQSKKMANTVKPESVN